MYEWAYTTNPIGGRCPHECSYCYVGKLRRRGLKKYEGSPFLDERWFKTNLAIPEQDKVVFIQSCGDLFAYGIDQTWIWRILGYIKKFPETTFLLQTKNPESFFEFNIPQNCILGTTIETNRNYGMTKAPNPKERYYVFFELKNQRNLEGDKVYRLMVSIEPVMDFDLDELVFWLQEIDPEFVSIGADSAKHGLPEPEPQKLRELIEMLQKFTEVRQKKNLSRLLTVKV
jgi:DNA repair photolyase